MTVLRESITRIKRFMDYIDRVMRSREIDCGESWRDSDAAYREINALAHPRDYYVSDSQTMGIETQERLIFAAYVSHAEGMLRAVEERASKLCRDKETTELQIIFFAPDLKSRIELDEAFDAAKRGRIRKLLKRNARGERQPVLRCMYILDQEHPMQTVRLDNLNRNDILQMPPVLNYINQETAAPDWMAPEGEPLPTSLLFNINLYQLAKVYNLVGDQLFQNNVRFGIRETLGVNRAIQETLREEPWNFWYKNNGVTILVEAPDFKPKLAQALELGTLDAESHPNFSVVNGAQTITVAAEFFYRLERRCAVTGNEADKMTLKRARDMAYVLVRVIHIPKSGEETASHLVKDISVSLNRQKPIKVEDIAFTTSFVEKLTAYLNSQEGGFRLVRRGEESLHNTLDLVEFARARTACAGKPGDARAKDASQLLKVQPDDNGNYEFANQEVFPAGWMDAQGREEEGPLFLRYYGAVWFAHQVAQKYDGYKNTLKGAAPERESIIKNGKWYFTALTVQIMNDFAVYTDDKGNEFPDFSRFKATVDDIGEDFQRAVESFSAFVYDAAKDSDRRSLDSNVFKRNDLYFRLYQKLRGSAAHRPRNAPLSERFCGYGEQENPQAAANCVILGKERVPIRSITDAMELTVAYILREHAPTDDIPAACYTWLHEGAPGEEGYFSRYRTVEVNGSVYCIGISSSTKVKVRQITSLCAWAGVPQGTIQWCAKDPNRPVFQW